jgi:hypothetical protein
LYLRLEPLSWRQEIRYYPTITVEGRYLVASCKTIADSHLRLSNNAKLTDLSVELSILVGQPVDARGEALKDGIIGDFQFLESPPSDYDPRMDPFISACVYLKPDSYSALWDQVRDGGYASCEITISIDPVKSEGFGWAWDVSQRLAISSVALNFTRSPIAQRPADQATPRKSFFAWFNPSAAADAELDAAVVDILNQDVEKRRRNAWLRKIGGLGRIVVYACLFAALFFFKPEGASELTTKPLSQVSLGNIIGAVVWIIVALLLLNALFKPNPRPDFQEAWGFVSVVLIVGALCVGVLFLYLRA